MENNKELLIFYNTEDVAKCLNCSLPTARQLFHSKGFPAFKVGKNWKVSKVAFEQWALTRGESIGN